MIMFKLTSALGDSVRVDTLMDTYMVQGHTKNNTKAEYN